MSIRSLASFVRRTMFGGDAALAKVEGVAGPDWYDQAYRKIGTYSQPYWQSHYYFLWCVLADRVRRAGAKNVLDIGSGPGQFAESLFDLAGIDQYVGLDFSPEAVAMARSACQRGKFYVGDALSTDLHETFNHDITICTEVLEHIPDDLGVIKLFVGRCLCTVPNFPYDSHVRHFSSATQVRERYAHLLDDLDVWALRGHYSPDHVYFLMDGIRRRS